MEQPNNKILTKLLENINNISDSEIRAVVKDRACLPAKETIAPTRCKLAFVG